jgi:hypothetical protein
MRAHISVLRQVLAFAGHLWRGAAHRRQQCQEAMTPGQVEVYIARVPNLLVDLV